MDQARGKCVVFVPVLARSLTHTDRHSHNACLCFTNNILWLSSGAALLWMFLPHTAPDKTRLAQYSLCSAFCSLVFHNPTSDPTACLTINESCKVRQQSNLAEPRNAFLSEVLTTWLNCNNDCNTNPPPAPN